MDKTWEEACRGCPIAIVLDPHGHSYDEPHHAEEAQLRKQEAQQTEREERLAQREARLDVAERRLGAEKDRVVIGGGETCVEVRTREDPPLSSSR